MLYYRPTVDQNARKRALQTCVGNKAFEPVNSRQRNPEPSYINGRR